MSDPEKLHDLMSTDEAFITIVIIMVGSCVYMMDKIYKKDSKMFWFIVFFPLALLWAAYKYREDLYQAMIYFGVFLLFVICLSLATRINYVMELCELIAIVAVWPLRALVYIKQNL